MLDCVQVTDADVQQLREATVPPPTAFLRDMQQFSCIPRNINNEDTPLVRWHYRTLCDMMVC